MPSLESGLYDLGRLDRLADSDTWVHRLDPRAKVIVTGVYLVCVVSFGKYALAPLVPFLLFPVAMAAAGGIPLGFLMRKVVAVAPFALVGGAFNPLIDRAPVLSVAGVGIAAGWISFASILLRFVATSTSAASAGPTRRAALNCAEESAIAFSSELRGTRSGTIACHAGNMNAETTPAASVSA
jgi:cobalt/nickel transport system permease protein